MIILEAIRFFKKEKEKDEMQVLSLSGSDAVLKRCRSILCMPDSKLALIAAFSQELNILKDDIKGLQNSAKEVNILSFGSKPEWLNHAGEHLSEDLIEKAQGGRLLMIASFPQALIAVLRANGTAY
jgi:HTH-type transcriptional regulator, sugar sensing transcriptional regulator